jgi:hypothetical protein
MDAEKVRVRETVSRGIEAFTRALIPNTSQNGMGNGDINGESVIVHEWKEECLVVQGGTEGL